jgi:pimeloyl-ACP methyl ester carboxylesterase
MRGLGDSSRPASGYDKRTIAADIRELVRKLRFEKIMLVGHDWADRSHTHTPAAIPTKYTDSLFSTSPYRMRPGSGCRRSADAVASGTWHFTRCAIFPKPWCRSRERTYLSWFYRTAAYNPAAITDADIDEYVRCYSAPGALRAGFEYYRAIFADIDQNKENGKSRLKMPVLALGGERGFRSAPLKCMQELAHDVRGGVVEGSGHWIPEERPDYLLEQLFDFF